MRRIFISVLLILVATFPTWAQDVSAVELQIEGLRDVVDLEAQLQDRAARLDEDLGPESIERSVVSIGTRDATALRARKAPVRKSAPRKRSRPKKRV